MPLRKIGELSGGEKVRFRHLPPPAAATGRRRAPAALASVPTLAAAARRSRQLLPRQLLNRRDCGGASERLSCCSARTPSAIRASAVRQISRADPARSCAIGYATGFAILLGWRNPSRRDGLRACAIPGRSAARSAAGLRDWRWREPLRRRPRPQARVALAAFSLVPYNCLLLDEPSNHLDAGTIDMLTRALQAFPGAIVAITHNQAGTRPTFSISLNEWPIL